MQTISVRRKISHRTRVGLRPAGVEVGAVAVRAQIVAKATGGNAAKVVGLGLRQRVAPRKALPAQPAPRRLLPLRLRGQPVAVGRPVHIRAGKILSLIHISEPTRLGMISYAVFCLKKK